MEVGFLEIVTVRVSKPRAFWKFPGLVGTNGSKMSLSFQERFKDRTSVLGKQGEVLIRDSAPVNKPADATNLTFGKGSQTSALPFANFQPRGGSESFQFVRPIRIPRPEDNSVARLTPVTNAATEPVGLGEDYSKRAEMQVSLASFGSVPVVQRSVQAVKEGRPPRVPRPQPRSAQPTQVNEQVKPVEEVKKVYTAPPSEQEEIATPKRSDYTPYTIKDYRSIRPNKYMQLGGLGAFMVGTEDWQRKKELHDKRKSYARQVLQSNANRIALSLSKPRADRSEPSPENARQRALEFARRVHPPARRFRDAEIRTEPDPGERDQLGQLEDEHERLRSYVEEMKARLMS